MQIALMGTEDDRAYLTRFRELVGTVPLKVSLTQESYFTQVKAKVLANKLTHIICTNAETMTMLLTQLVDFRHPLDARGLKRKLSLDSYAGSYFTIPGYKFSETHHDVKVLVLNPLSHIVQTPAGSFIFKRFLSKITRPDSWFPQTQFTWEVWTPERSQEQLARFSKARILSCDIETYRGDEHRRIHCVGYAALFPDGTTHTIVVPFKCMLAHAFVRQLNSTNIPKIFQNGMYDNAYFMRWGVPVTAYLHDTQHLFHSWYSELPKRLDFITAFTVRDIRYWKDDSAGSEFNMFEYNAKDCWATLTAYCALSMEIPEWAHKNYLMEFPMVFPCLHTELDGLFLDQAAFNIAKAEAEARLEVQKVKLEAWFGPQFNPASPDQCKRLLQVLGMGNVESADSKAMTACAAVHPFNELIITAITAYRKQAKLLSTYFKWEKFWNGRLYYRTNPAGTDTGRMASTESSFWTGLQIQNIPGGGGVKTYIRADDGYLIGEADFSQAEARGVAYLSGCKPLIDLVESDKDYHSWNAHKFFGVQYEEVSKPLRNLSKRVNHGSNYNMSAGVLLDTMGPKNVAEAKLLLKLPAKWTLLQVCQHLIRTYEETYPEVKRDWYDHIKRTIKITKKLVSAIGWTRHFFDDPTKAKPALNAAVAHGPQNLNAGILNQVFYRIWWDSMYGDLKGHLRMKAQIHDSILFTYRKESTHIPSEIQKRMQISTTVTDCHGVSRVMIVPSDVNAGKVYWSELK